MRDLDAPLVGGLPRPVPPACAPIGRGSWFDVRAPASGDEVGLGDAARTRDRALPAAAGSPRWRLSGGAI